MVHGRRTVLQDLVEALQVVHDDCPVLLEDRHGYEDMEIGRHKVRPQSFPKSKDILKFEFALVPNQQGAEKEEEICAVEFLQMKIQLRVEKLHEMIERLELQPHSRLVAKEVALLLVVSGLPDGERTYKAYIPFSSCNA